MDTVAGQSRHRHIIQASEVGPTDAKAKTDNGLLLDGVQCKEVATQLGTTCQVIKNSVVLIYDKLGVRSRYDLLKAFLESPDDLRKCFYGTTRTQDVAT